MSKPTDAFNVLIEPTVYKFKTLRIYGKNINKVKKFKKIWI